MKKPILIFLFIIGVVLEAGCVFYCIIAMNNEADHNAFYCKLLGGTYTECIAVPGTTCLQVINPDNCKETIVDRLISY